jgi:HAD superfamily hydrolase (TIGR01509 family)
MSLDEVKLHMYGKNEELFVRLFPKGKFSDDEINRIALQKEEAYRRTFKPHLKLINGLDKFLEQAWKKNIPMAIGSAAISGNVDFVLDGLNIRKYIPVTVSADDVELSKPHPETFIKAAERLGVPAENCIVFEDNPKGVESALNAGMNAVVLTTMHEEHEFDGLLNVLTFAKDYTDPFFQQLLDD